MVLIKANDTLHIGFSTEPLLLLRIRYEVFTRFLPILLQKNEISKKLLFVL
jgi:hypothetical protein